MTEAANSGRQLREAEGARIGQLLEGQTRFDASSSSATCRAGSAGSVAVPRSD